MKRNPLLGSPQMVWFGQGSRAGFVLSVLLCCVLGTVSKAQITPVGPGGSIAPKAVSIYFSVPDSTEIILVTAQGKPYFITAGTHSLVTQYNVKDFRRAFPNSKYRHLRNLYTLSCNSISFGSDMNTLNPVKFPFWEAIPENFVTGNYYPNDTATAQVAGENWRYLDYINAPRAWFVTKGSPNTSIGIADTYLETSHTEFANKISGVVNSNVSGPIDHGTAVSGMAAAATDNSYGMPSIGFNCKISFTSIWKDPKGDSSMLDFSRAGIKVVNGSWGNGGSPINDPAYHVTPQSIYNEVYENGTVACFSAGNAGTGPATNYLFPASLDHNISVSSIGWKRPYGSPAGAFNVKDVYERIIGNSTNCNWRNDRVDILAPSDELVLPTYDPNNSNTKFAQTAGTSFSSPLVAGTVALMQTANPCLSPYQIEYILKKSANGGVLTKTENLPYAGKLGAGKLDAGQTLENVQEGTQSTKITEQFGCNSPLTQTFRVLGVNFNTLCAPGVGAGGLKPRFSLRLENGTPPYSYYWQRLDNNQTKLSAVNVADPSVDSSWYSHIANYRVTVYDASPIQKIASVVFKVQLITNPAKAELALRDSYYDMLDEPNSMYDLYRNHWDIWKSPDVWNRQRRDNDTIHQDPEYFVTDSNYVYARIRNVGCATSTTSRISLFWSKASTGEKWRDDWDGTVSVAAHPSGVVPGGGIITEKNFNEIPTIPAGGTYTYVRGWRPPNPKAFYGEPTQVDACLLARLLEPPSYSYTPAETDTVKLNVLRQNNIVTRNLLVTDLNPGNRPRVVRWIDIVNGEDLPAAYSFQFINDRSINRHHSGSYAAIGRIKVNLGNLFDRWVAGGMMGTTGLQVLSDERAIIIDGTMPLRLDNLNLNPHERFPVGVEFSLFPDAEVNEGQVFEFAAQQFLQAGDPMAELDLEQVYGAVNFQTITHTVGRRAAPQLRVTPPAGNVPLLDLFPNPAGDKLNVLYSILAGKSATVIIYDVVGRVMQQATVSTDTNRSELDVQSLAPGLYILELRGEDGFSARKQFLKK